MSNAAGTNCPSSSQKYGRSMTAACEPNRTAANSKRKLRCAMTPLARVRLVDDATLLLILRLQPDFAEGRLVLRDVLLHHVQKRLRLLRTEIHARKILDRYSVRGALAQRAEQQKEIPEVYAHLDAVCIVLAVVRGVHDLNCGRFIHVGAL